MALIPLVFKEPLMGSRAWGVGGSTLRGVGCLLYREELLGGE